MTSKALPLNSEFSNMSPREQLLDEAARLVMNDRNNQYGPPSQDFNRTAGALNSLGFRVVLHDTPEELQPHHVAIMLDTVKSSRLMWNPEKMDSWADKAGYAACGWECVVDGPQ